MAKNVVRDIECITYIGDLSDIVFYFFMSLNGFTPRYGQTTRDLGLAKFWLGRDQTCKRVLK